MQRSTVSRRHMQQHKVTQQISPPQSSLNNPKSNKCNKRCSSSRWQTAQRSNNTINHRYSINNHDATAAVAADEAEELEATTTTAAAGSNRHGSRCNKCRSFNSPTKASGAGT